MPRVRVHQHVNPLSPYYRQPPEPLCLDKVFAKPELPLHLDIGCARGRFILNLAAIATGCNYLGVEIREPLVIEADKIAQEQTLGNLKYVFCNAMIWLARLLEQVPAGSLWMVTIQFPDPWFKKKHAKRRMVDAKLVADVCEKLAPDGLVYIQTDIEFLAAEMFALFVASERLVEVPLAGDLFPIKTERELAVESKGLRIYRKLFKKCKGRNRNGSDPLPRITS